MKLTYIGHSAVLIEEGQFKGIIDPYISKNPLCRFDINDVGNITHIFITHGHGEHKFNVQKYWIVKMYMI